MNDCIFCQIVKKELPSYKVYENQDFYGFLDIFPISKGHCLLIPKQHYRWIYEVPNFGQYWEIAKQIGLKAKEVVRADSINFLTIGEEIAHAHVWIIPRFKGDGEVIGVKRMQEKFSNIEMAKLANQISAQLSQE